MPDYNVHFFIIRRPVHPQAGTTGPSPGSGAPSSYFAQFLQQYQDILRDLFQRSVTSIPGNDSSNSRGWQVNVRQIPQGSAAGVPDFSSYVIQNFEPIIYLSQSSHGSSPPTSRRASYAMLDAIQEGHFRNIPDANLSDFRNNLRRRPPFQEGGMSTIPWDATNPTDDLRYAPVVAEVFTNMSPMSAPDLFAGMTPAEMSRNWVDVMSNFLAKASFHEIAHCKAESHNRPNGSTYSNVISGSIHNGSGVSVLSATVPWNASASTGDFNIMGHHMLCPMPFYKLGEPISPQCTNHGSPRALVPGPPPQPVLDLNGDI